MGENQLPRRSGQSNRNENMPPYGPLFHTQVDVLVLSTPTYTTLTNSCFSRDCSVRSKVARDDAVSPRTSPSVCSCQMVWLRWWQMALTFCVGQGNRGKRYMSKVGDEERASRKLQLLWQAHVEENQ